MGIAAKLGGGGNWLKTVILCSKISTVSSIDLFDNLVIATSTL